MSLSSGAWLYLPCLLSICLSVAVGAQSIASITVGVNAEAKRVVILGSGFSESDEITVAGIPLEKVTITENRIEASLPAGVRLVGGDYVVKVSGKSTARGSLRISSELVATAAKPEVAAAR